jgi:hypothetical protein
VRALVIGALAVSLAGCSCFLPPQANIVGCTDPNGLACFDRADASQPIEPMLASFKTDSGPAETKPAIEKRVTVRTAVPAPKPKANKDPSSDAEIVQRHEGEKTAPAAPNEPPAGGAQDPPADPAWIVSETTSPVDYSPLTTAVIHATFSEKDAPNTLTVRCAGARTELMLRTEGASRATHTGEIPIDHRINDEAWVRLQWTVSADGKSAYYKGDTVGLLRSLPDGARLKITVLGPGPIKEAIFQLTGWDGVRKRIGSACKWSPTAPG